MKNLIKLSCLLLLIVGYQTVAAQGNIAEQAFLVLEQNCLNCHGKHGSFTENLIIDEDDPATLIESGAVVPGIPLVSKLYTRLTTKNLAKRMPLGQPKLDAASIRTIGDWILKGAPSWVVEHDVNFITTDTMLTAMQQHLQTLDLFDRPYARYFTMTHLYNAGETVEALNAYKVALSKLVNSLSWGFEIHNPEPIGAKNTIFYIDLRDYEWDRVDAWTEIENAYPYAIEYNPSTQAAELAKLTDLQTQMKCEVPFVHVDWFLANAALPPLYHDILDLPKTDRELERKLDVDVQRNLQTAPGVRVWRAGFNDSGVSNNNRVVERHTSRYGAYWKSYDFAGSTGTQNVFTHPLSFKADGGEIIFNLPNGLQAYYILDALGNHIDSAPPNIVADPSARDPIVYKALSCIGCHTEGMKRFEDEVRSVVNQTREPAFDKAQALRLYVAQATMDRLLDEDTARYKAALEKTGGVFGGIEPVQRFHKAYQGDVGAAYAAASVGLEMNVFLSKIREDSRLQSLGLAPFLNGKNVKRDVWTSQFPEVVSPTSDRPPCCGPTPLFPDPHLQAAIVEALGLAQNEEITVEAMKRLTRLVADRKGIRDLTGLEMAINLERIELRHNAISDLTPLAELFKLNNIKLRDNAITDVSPLSNLINVDWMGLEENDITDVSPLSGLVKLNGIGISGNPVSDISSLASLISLEGIAAWNTSISDFSALARLPRLRWVEFGNDKTISALPTLKGLRTLRRLQINGCSISNVSALSELTQLEWLELVNNLISDVSPLAELTGLKTLNLDANVISDPSPLVKLTDLEVLYLENNAISDVSALAQFRNLNRLDLRNNAISDFSPLKGLLEETFVRMEGNPGFPSGGPKITGPWLWAIVPGTRLEDNVDFLALATNSAATELKVATNGAKEGKAVGNSKWTLHRLSASGGDNINRMTDALGWGTREEIYDKIVYGSVVLDSPEEQRTTMFVGSNDAVKVWLNGELVHQAFVKRDADDYQDFFSVTLKQGKNVLLVALDNHGHGRFSGFFGFAPEAKYEVFQPGINFAFSTETTQLKVGNTFTVHLIVENIDNLAGWQTNIVFNRSVLRALSVTEGDFLKQDGGKTFFEDGTISNTTGKITGLQAVQLSKGKMSRQGTLLSMRFVTIANGESQITVDNFQAGSKYGKKIPVTPPEITLIVGGNVPAAPSARAANREQLLAALIPENTDLLHNYPNPFNPETWIPYQLTESAEITVHIYAASGALVRTLTLGHQAAGIYQSQSRAVYWDGKNEVGEWVASGVYFYTLTAGDFTATRKMLIAK